jgi:hypothetical protein
MTPARPLDELVHAAGRGSTGEFICATTALEIHVYVQHGRIAWATVSSHPFEFVRHIKQHARIDDETFKQVLDECRREKLPLGETLVAWELVTWDAVRAALRHQVQLAIRALAELGAGRTMFLERKRFTEYNEGLTLELPEIIAALGQARHAPARASGAPRTANGRFAQQLYESIEGATWVELSEAGQLVDQAPSLAAASRVPPALSQTTLDDEADFVAVRTARGSLVGLTLAAQRRALWCALAAESTFGAAVSTLWTLAQLEPSAGAGDEELPTSHEVEWEIGDRAASTVNELRLFLERAREVMAVVVLLDGRQPMLGVARGGLDVEHCLALLRRRARALAVPLFHDGGRESGQDTRSLDLQVRMLATGERHFWCFGAELFGEPTQSLWVLTDRRSSQGLGWACLAALGRVIAQSAHRRGGPT